MEAKDFVVPDQIEKMGKWRKEMWAALLSVDPKAMALQQRDLRAKKRKYSDMDIMLEETSPEALELSLQYFKPRTPRELPELALLCVYKTRQEIYNAHAGMVNIINAAIDEAKEIERKEKKQERDNAIRCRDEELKAMLNFPEKIHVLARKITKVTYDKKTKTATLFFRSSHQEMLNQFDVKWSFRDNAWKTTSLGGSTVECYDAIKEQQWKEFCEIDKVIPAMKPFFDQIGDGALNIIKQYLC
jgi:hypothetical protein